MGRLRRVYTSLVVTVTLLGSDIYPMMSTPNAPVQTAINYLIEEQVDPTGDNVVRPVTHRTPNEDGVPASGDSEQPCGVAVEQATDHECDSDDGYNHYPSRHPTP